MFNTPWESILNNWSLDDAVKIFTDTFLSIMNSNIPNKIATFDGRYAPWITPSLKNLLCKDRRIFSNWKKHMIPADYARIKQHQEKAKKAICIVKHRQVWCSLPTWIFTLNNKINIKIITMLWYTGLEIRRARSCIHGRARQGKTTEKCARPFASTTV